MCNLYKKILNGIYYKAVTIPGGKPFAIVAIIVQLFLKATLTTKIMIQAILLPLARTTTFLEFITWPSEIWQGKKNLNVSAFCFRFLHFIVFQNSSNWCKLADHKHYFPNSDESCHLQGQQPF
jgi:hypothetical protein